MNEEEEAAARAELLTAQLAAAKADRTIKLNDFTGDNVPFINWMQHVNMSIAAAAWSQETSATRVQLALKGRAGVWFQNQLVLGVEGLDVWYPPEMGGVRPPNLLTLMEQRFHKAMSPLEQCNLRSTLTQKENEDSQNFFDRVVSVQLEFDKSLPLTFKIESKAAYTIGHNQAVFTNFVCGLRSEIRAHVTTAQATTVPDACRAAAAYELGAISKKPKAATGSVLGMESQNAYGADSLVSQIAALTASFRGGQGGRGRGSRGGGPNANNRQTHKMTTVYLIACTVAMWVTSDPSVTSRRKTKLQASTMTNPQASHPDEWERAPGVEAEEVSPEEDKYMKWAIQGTQGDNKLPPLGTRQQCLHPRPNSFKPSNCHNNNSNSNHNHKRLHNLDLFTTRITEEHQPSVRNQLFVTSLPSRETEGDVWGTPPQRSQANRQHVWSYTKHSIHKLRS